MARFTKILPLLACGAAVLATGCKPTGSVKSPDDYIPFVAMALEGGSTAALVGENEAKAKGAFGACVATSVTGTAFSTTSDALVSYSPKTPQIPGVEVDVSDCLEFAPNDPEGKPVGDDLKALIDSWTGSVLQTVTFFLARLEAQNCKGYQAGLAAVAYIEAIKDPIIDEISNPDGKLSLAQVTINFGACDDEG